MSERSYLRLFVLGVLVMSLLVTLMARLYYLQIASAETYLAAAANNSTREVVTPAVRGLILDQAGRPLVSNRISLVVTVDRTVIDRLDDDGRDVLTRLAAELGTTHDAISERLKSCGTEGAPKPPICWNGSPYQPIPIARDVPTETALRIMERRASFPGVRAQLEAVREYQTPWGVNAAHILGYLGPVTQEQLDAVADSQDPKRLRRTDLVGRSGLEEMYDEALRGTPGIRSLAVDAAGRVTGTLGDVAPTPGNYLVTNVDAHLQSVVEDELRLAVNRARAEGNPGDTGAAVVLDVRTGAVLAMASYPTYDPSVWIGGISTSDYERLMKDQALTATAFQGSYAPGSTFKVVTTLAAAEAGFDLNGDYDCPSEFAVGSQVFRNNESSSYGMISLSRALEVSCNTVFYGIGDKMWHDAGGLNAGAGADDPVAEAAGQLGLGTQTGLDLPGESRGRVAGREFRLQQWQDRKATWCANAAAGYPETRKVNPKLAEYYTLLDAENCREGYIWREGDAINTSIGQGDTTVTPLQMAVAYAAIANGGTVWQPQVAKAIMSSTGEVVRRFEPVATGRLTAGKSGRAKAALAFLQSALPGVTVSGTGVDPFVGFPLDQIPVAAKTGSAQVFGNEISTSWFASYAPANDPKYAVIMMVSQGGTGSGTSGPSVRKIYEALFGVVGTTVDPARSVLVGAEPSRTLPTISSDGTPVVPEGKALPRWLPGATPVVTTVASKPKDGEPG